MNIQKRPITKKVIIYILKDPITNKVRYVGKTETSLQKRLYDHIYNKTKTPKSSWIQSLLKQNLKPLIEEIERTTRANWIEREIYWISFYKNQGEKLTNSTLGGDGRTGGFFVSKETRLKLSNSSKGRKHTEVTKQKIGIANKNCTVETRQRKSLAQKHRSKEHQEKITKANTGQKRTLITKQKISVALQGKLKGCTKSQETKQKMSAAQKLRFKDNPIVFSEFRKKQISARQLGKKRGPYKNTMNFKNSLV